MFTNSSFHKYTLFLCLVSPIILNCTNFQNKGSSIHFATDTLMCEKSLLLNGKWQIRAINLVSRKLRPKTSRTKTSKTVKEKYLFGKNVFNYLSSLKNQCTLSLYSPLFKLLNLQILSRNATNFVTSRAI